MPKRRRVKHPQPLLSPSTPSLDEPVNQTVSVQTVASAVLATLLLAAVFSDLLIGSQVDVLLWATQREDVAVKVDGQSFGVLRAGTQMPLPVSLRRSTQIEFQHLGSGRIVHQRVNPLSRIRLSVVPSDPAQCFVVTQLRPFWFERGPTAHPQKVVRRIQTGQPFDVATREPWPKARVVLTGPQMQVAPHERVDTLDELPCEIAAQSDDDIMRYLDALRTVGPRQ